MRREILQVMKNLSHDGITLSDVKFYTDVIKKLTSDDCPSSIAVNLKNDIADKKALALAEALQSGHIPSGFLLDIWGHISDTGAAILGKAIMSGKCPSRLQLKLDNIGKFSSPFLKTCTFSTSALNSNV